jgi:pyridoxal phosphate enzyme (YggS family)
MGVTENLQRLYKDIPKGITIVATSKGNPTSSIIEAYNFGIRDFGESRLQEALPKIKELQALKDIHWHFIGRLQSNKLKEIIENFEYIHSVSDLEHLKIIEMQASSLKRRPKIFIQINVGNDPSKAGLSWNELLEWLSPLKDCKNIDVLGLMTILPYGLKPAENLELFKKLAGIRETININNTNSIQFTSLSMGMSLDYKEAIEAGSNFLRIGRAIFS